ncbi:MAG: hypothetical protein K8T90_06630 [Planctomycetes bacterium]|nr:hypothetical protein [Planctomycetota bacterium]
MLNRCSVSRCCALALIAAFAFAAAPAVLRVAPAFADGDGDGGDGEDGAEGTDGADGAAGGDAPATPVEKPTMDGAIDVGDAKRMVSIKVPKSWKQPEGFEAKGTSVAFFSGAITEKFQAFVELHVDPANSRAALALSKSLDGSKVAPEEARSGPGWCEGASETTGRRRWFAWERWIEKDGVVYCATVATSVPAREGARALARQILDTFKIAGGSPKPQMPPKVALRKAGDFDLWTDADDKGKPGRVADLAASGRDAAAKALKGKPYDESRPVLKVYQVGSLYVEATAAAYGSTPDFAAFDPLTRSLPVQLYRIDADRFPTAVQEAGARQFIAQYFGGLPPEWVDVGLRWYCSAVAESGGKPDKLESFRTEAVRKLVPAGKSRLDEWMAGTGVPAAGDDARGYELMAWHWFIRHGPGRKYGKQYGAFLDTLRQSGDVAAARKAWDGVDFAVMNTEFRDWAAKWK